MSAEDKISNGSFIVFITIISLMMITLLIFLVDMYIRQRNEEEYCRKIPYEEYKIDTRCHEILED